MQRIDGAPRPPTVLAQTELAGPPRRTSAHRFAGAALLAALLGCAGALPVARDAEVAAPAGATSSASPSAGSHLRGAALGAAPSSAARGDASGLPWLTPSRVGAAVRAHRGDFQACQALGDLESRREDGAVTVGWMVHPDGSVNEVTVGPTTFQSARINACVLDVARQVTFPPSAAPTNVSWTVKFRGASHAPLATVR